MSKKNFTQIINRTVQESDVFLKEKLLIDADLKNFIPSLQEDQKQQLEENILKEGIRESLIVWKEENILIDGYNRYEIAQKHSLKFQIKTISFSSRDDVYVWMINNQLGRRNLTAEQASYLRGLRYQKEKAQGKRVDLTCPQNEDKSIANTSPQNEDKLKLSKRLAKEYNVGHATIERDAQFAKAIDKIGEVNPALRKEILSGATRINKSQIQEIAKMEALPHLENIQDLENLFLSKTEKTTDELKAKKDHLLKFIKSTNFDLMSLEQIEKLCLDSNQKF